MGEDNKKFGELVSKCWADGAFKQRFLTDPKKVLAEFEIEVPDGLNVKVVENTDDTMHITLPAKPTRSELSDDQLDSVSGGAGVTNIAKVSATSARTIQYAKFRTVTVHTSAGAYTCSTGTECVPW